MRAQTRLLLQEQSDLGILCLTKRVPKHLDRRRKQPRFIVIGALRLNDLSDCKLQERRR